MCVCVCVCVCLIWFGLVWFGFYAISTIESYLPNPFLYIKQFYFKQFNST